MLERVIPAALKRNAKNTVEIKLTSDWTKIELTSNDLDESPMPHIPSHQVMGQYDDVESTLATSILHDVTKHGYDHHDAATRIEILLKPWLHAIPLSRLVTERTMEGTPTCNVAPMVAEAMVAKRTVHAASNIVELFW